MAYSQGRLVLPAALRRELGLHPGERLLARVKDGALIAASVLRVSQFAPG